MAHRNVASTHAAAVDPPAPGFPGASGSSHAASAHHAATANSVETDNENGATYEVEVTKPDGTTVDVRLDENYQVVVIEGDSDTGGN